VRIARWHRGRTAADDARIPGRGSARTGNVKLSSRVFRGRDGRYGQSWVFRGTPVIAIADSSSAVAITILMPPAWNADRRSTKIFPTAPTPPACSSAVRLARNQGPISAPSAGRGPGHRCHRRRAGGRPRRVTDLGALNRWPERTGVPLEDYLHRWSASCGDLGASGRLRCAERPASAEHGARWHLTPKGSPRLCRGGSKSLTFTAVVHRRSSRPRANRHTDGILDGPTKRAGRDIRIALSPAGAADRII
jgi:hypothetical protein